MKKFFELLGFLCTAAITAFVVFSMLGKQERERSTPSTASSSVRMRPSKDAPREEMAEIEFSKSARRAEELPQLPKISKKNVQAPSTPAPDNGIENPEIANLLTDRAFAKNMIQEWKGAVTDAAEQHSLQAAALMAHILVQSYTDVYSKAQLRRDAARHAGDVVMGADAAARRYAQGAMVQQVMQGLRLAQYFPQEQEAQRTVYAGVGSGAGKKTSAALAPKATTSAAITTTARGAGRSEHFKAMVAKEYGAKDWKALQNQADAKTKAKAEKRAKMLSTASVIR
jgi:hypothetical protein